LSSLRRQILDTHSISYQDDYLGAHDYEFMCQISMKAEVTNISEILYQYRINNKQESLNRILLGVQAEQDIRFDRYKVPKKKEDLHAPVIERYYYWLLIHHFAGHHKNVALLSEKATSYIKENNLEQTNAAAKLFSLCVLFHVANKKIAYQSSFAGLKSALKSTSQFMAQKVLLTLSKKRP